MSVMLSVAEYPLWGIIRGKHERVGVRGGDLHPHISCRRLKTGEGTGPSQRARSLPGLGPLLPRSVAAPSGPGKERLRN